MNDSYQSSQSRNILAGGKTVGCVQAGREKRGQERAYYLKDHTSTTLRTGLGSVRVTVTEDGSVLGWAVSAHQRNDYYPFGLQMDGRSSNSANTFDVQ